MIWPVWIAGALGVGYLLSRGGRMVLPYALSVANAARFMLGLPTQTRPYAAELWEAGKIYGIDPFVLAGIMERESISGAALYPRGPTGTGDWTARPPGWSISKHGKIVTQLPLTDGVLRWKAHPTLPNGPYYIPEDEKGWGRGLMQLDFAIHYDWLRSHDWTNPATIIRKAASVLGDNLAMAARAGLKGATLLHAAVSGYNLTPSVAIAAAKAGKNPDEKTTGGNYARDTTGAKLGVLDRADAFQKASGIKDDSSGAVAGLGDDQTFARQAKARADKLIRPHQPAAGRIAKPHLRVPRFYGPGRRPPGRA